MNDPSGMATKAEDYLQDNIELYKVLLTLSL
jgi:hypothetical protein